MGGCGWSGVEGAGGWRTERKKMPGTAGGTVRLSTPTVSSATFSAAALGGLGLGLGLGVGFGFEFGFGLELCEWGLCSGWGYG